MALDGLPDSAEIFPKNLTVKARAEPRHSSVQVSNE